MAIGVSANAVRFGVMVGNWARLRTKAMSVNVCFWGRVDYMVGQCLRRFVASHFTHGCTLFTVANEQSSPDPEMPDG